MLDVDQQLARLRERIARIDRKYLVPKPQVTAGVRLVISGIIGGTVIENEFGPHLELERSFPSHHQHGSADVGALSEVPASLLDVLARNDIPSAAPTRWAFLDTETTGLAGGSGTYAFLVGVGRITERGFTVRQYFMREYSEERSLLLALEQELSEFDVLVTYNGRAYDQPLLETRYRMNRRPPPFSRLGHLDLLYGARRLWKMQFESCRLVQLEREVLGVEREGDIPGELIPYAYFDYLRSQNAERLLPVFHHNRLDILSLACLTAIVPAAFESTDPASLARLGLRRGPELAGLGRWLRAAGDIQRAGELLKRAVDAGLPDRLLFQTLWDLACLEKKQKRPFEALRIFVELSGCRNDFQVAAFEELAKFYEHREKNYALALDFTEQALSLQRTGVLAHRQERLRRLLESPRPRKLL
ncbi:MAG TPA: ribonuclease H-like domain-containing protein [Bryobacteraceae bacterium]|nr:ribonuclease H-like domain-containing protein [Bryobacteraceae bacterium]